MQTKVVVSESRPLDALYDQLYTRKKSGGLSRRMVYTSQRPLVPQLDAVSPSILLSPPEKEKPTLNIKKAKDAWAQTDYRESEAQTLPYAPEGMLPNEESSPEILALADLGPLGTRGGLMTQSELKCIEEARAKRNLMLSLPPGTDEASLALRKRLLEEQEIREFTLKQTQIDQANQIQLEAIRSALHERDRENEFLADRRLEVIKNLRVQKNENDLQKIQQNRIKILRKVAQARKNVQKPQAQRDLVQEYANFSSSVYAPITRQGLRKNNFQVKEIAQILPQILSHEVAEIQAYTVKDDIKNHSITVDAKRPSKRRSLVNDLERAAALINTATTNTPQCNDDTENSKPNLTLTVQERPSTPRLDRSTDDELYSALVLVQRLLRGRAVQDELFAAKNRRIDLITELRKNDLHQQKQIKDHTTIALAAVDAIAGHVTTALLGRLCISSQEEDTSLQDKEQEAQNTSLDKEAEMLRLARLESAQKCVTNALTLRNVISPSLEDTRRLFVHAFVSSIFTPLHQDLKHSFEFATCLSRRIIQDTLASLQS